MASQSPQVPIGILAKVYRSWKNLLYVLNLCRFSVLMVLAGVLLQWSAQGQDMLLGIAGAHFFWDQFLFLVFLVFWAWSAWFFARIMLYFDFRPEEAPQDPLEVKNISKPPCWTHHWWRLWIPRILLALAFLGTWWNLLNAAQSIDQDLHNYVSGLAWITLVVGFVFFVLVSFRRDYSKYLPLVPESRKTDELIQSKCELAGNKWISFSILILFVGLLVGSWFAPSLVKKFFFLFPILAIAIMFIFLRSFHKFILPNQLGSGTRWTIYILIGLAIGLCILSILDPLFVSKYVVFHEPIILFMIWAATTTAFGSGIVYWSNHSGFPILTALFILAVFFSFINDNHNLRQVEEGLPYAEEVERIKNRPTVDQAANAWLTAAQKEQHVDDRPVPVVVVATAGGGIRAAYWTVTVLGRLSRIDGFDRHLFAISGVSGGSVGAAVYRAVLADLKELKEDQRPSCASGIDVSHANHAIEPCAQQVLEGDLLVPIMAGTLYPDLVQRFWPFGDQTGLSFPDRQSALEKGFEAAYKDVMGSDRFAQSLLTLYAKQQQDVKESWPALLLNATWVSMGRRMVASNLDLSNADDRSNAYDRSNADAASKNLITVYDQLGCIGRDLRLSTAAGNSARFPGLSPAGTLRVPEDGKNCWLAGCALRLMVASDGNAEDEIIRKFKMEFESKKKECAVLIVRVTSNSEKWTLAGFNDAEEFRKVPINDPNDELSKELEKEPINKSRIIELATSSLGRTRPAAEQGPPLKRGDVFGHLLDGGYFENFGAKTAQEVLSMLINAAKNNVRIRPIVIQISSDPSLPDDFDQIADPDPVSFGYEVRQPLLAAFATRSAHGILAAKELQQYTESLPPGRTIGPINNADQVECSGNEGIFLHFNMIHDKGVVDPPLGWMLSHVAQLRIKRYLDKDDTVIEPLKAYGPEFDDWVKKTRDNKEYNKEYKGNLENLRIIRKVFDDCYGGNRIEKN